MGETLGTVAWCSILTSAALFGIGYYDEKYNYPIPLMTCICITLATTFAYWILCCTYCQSSHKRRLRPNTNRAKGSTYPRGSNEDRHSKIDPKKMSGNSKVDVDPKKISSNSDVAKNKSGNYENKSGNHKNRSENSDIDPKNKSGYSDGDFKNESGNSDPTTETSLEEAITTHSEVDPMTSPSSDHRPIILYAGGTYNPLSIMHLRLFEIARDYFQGKNKHVLGGILSPAHDNYHKTDITSAVHRIAMIQLALREYKFVKQSTWETEQEDWTSTTKTLIYHQNCIEDYCRGKGEKKPWMPDSLGPISDKDAVPRLVFICGGDLVESFGVPNKWKDAHLITLLQDFGIVVVPRLDADHAKVIASHPVVSKFKDRIYITKGDYTNISSTQLRDKVRHGWSILYLVPHPDIISYIDQHSLYKN